MMEIVPIKHDTNRYHFSQVKNNDTNRDHFSQVKALSFICFQLK